MAKVELPQRIAARHWAKVKTRLEKALAEAQLASEACPLEGATDRWLRKEIATLISEVGSVATNLQRR